MSDQTTDFIPPKASGELILVVDDEPSICKVIRIVLRNSGYEVVIAGSGEEALEIYSQRGGEIKAVLTDVSMPGMSGVQLISELKALNPCVKIVASSGQSDDGRTAELMALDVRGVIPKPYESRQLLVVLHKALA